MAWDRRLLSRTQNLTLLISGLRGTYPPFAPDGTYSKDAMARGTQLQFKVGLTKRYKPGKEHALEAKRTFGLVDDEEPGPSWNSNEPALMAIDSEGNTISEIDPLQGEEEEEEEEDDGRFDSFSLSSSLESLLDHSLIRVIQNRLKYGLGWAGAETLLHESERLQQTPEVVYAQSKKVSRALVHLF